MRHLKHDNVAVILFFQVLEGWFYQLVGESVRKTLKDGESSWGNGFLKVPQSPAHEQYFVSTTFSSCSSGNKKASKLQKQQGKMAKSEKRPEKVKKVEKVGKFAGKKKT